MASRYPYLEESSHQLEDVRTRDDQERQDRNIRRLAQHHIEVKWLAVQPSRVPAHFVVLDGRAISRRENPVLFAEWGIYYGEGDGTTTFNAPDLRGKMPIGASATDVVGSSALIAASGSAVVNAVYLVPVVVSQ